MGKIKTGSDGFLANITNTKEVWINGNITTYKDINSVRKKKGKNFSKGPNCVECDRPRHIRGHLCERCKDKLLEGKT